MPYATPRQLMELFGEREVLLLSTRGASGAPEDLDAPVLEAAIRYASGEVDSYLGVRYAVPLAEPVPCMVMLVTADIVRYRLTSGDVDEKSPVLRRYAASLEWLKAVAAGRLSLPDTDWQGVEDQAGDVRIEPGNRPWDGAKV